MEIQKFLIINAGSSSLKFSLYEMPSEKELINGYIEKIGIEDSFWTIKKDGNKIQRRSPLKTHDDAIKVMIDELFKNNVISDLSEISGVGHRVLHGGEKYSSSVIINDEVLNDIKSLTKLGPLHHPGEIAGILAMMKAMPEVPNIAVFDTAFHQTVPKENFMYPIPKEWYTKYGVRKYGFHGTSHKYITETMKKKLNKDDVNLIICHIGSGASISAIKNGLCFNTSMGLTPLDGLMMGTRSGEIDPSIIKYIMEQTGKNISEVTNDLNNKSGLLGITGKSDMRDVWALADSGDENAKLALSMYEERIAKFISEYYFELNGKVDAVVFTAGAGENDFRLRENVINRMPGILNIKVNDEVNNNIASFKDIHEGVITTNDSSISVYVIPTNEEVMILRDTYNLVSSLVKDQAIIKLK